MRYFFKIAPKKLLAVALTITMLFSLSTTAFAEGDGNAESGG